MSVTNYLNKTEGGTCKYVYSKLKDVVYLISSEHLKNIHIDNGIAYIDDLTELPLRINGFNIQFNEETSLDERYKFQKTLTLSMTGYVNYKLFEGRYYAIIETNDGTFYCINVDFPSKITHTFNLSSNTYQTDFTFSSVSNFPTLKLDADFEAVEPVCLGFNVYGIDKLQLLEKTKTTLDVANATVTSSDTWKTIEFLGNSCSFQEVYDGEKVTDTIEFQIAFNDYKPSWQYNLLEFLYNKYSAIITPKGNDNTFFAGFNFGLEPSYTIETGTQAGTSDIITVTLTESSSNGSSAAANWDNHQSTDTRWRFVKYANNIKCFECIGLGRARYLVKQEVDVYGNPTGNYAVKDGYQSQYTMFTIVDTFTADETFDTADCGDDNSCEITTTIPSIINFSAATCNTYTLRTSCDWSITELPSNITVTPSTGKANTNYNVTICNTAPATTTINEGTFTLGCCNTKRIITTKVQLPTDDCISPKTMNITCLQQTVTFTYAGNCTPTITNIDSKLTYSISNNQIRITVPKNTGTTKVTYTIGVNGCNCQSNVTITQDKLYDKWVETDGYICKNGDSYEELRRYTGSTENNMVITTETKTGYMIISGDSRCQSSVTEKWEWRNYAYYCYNDDRYKALTKMVSYDGGSTWKETSEMKLGELVETDSETCYCKEGFKSEEYELTTLWQCSGTTSYYLYRTKYCCDKVCVYPYPDVMTIGNNNYYPYATIRKEQDTECGYSPDTQPKYRFAETTGYICSGCAEYRWVTVEDDYVCNGYDKYTKEKQQKSTDGTNWVDTGEERRGDTVIEYNSQDCGYEPDYSATPLTFKALENGSFAFSDGIEYSIDNGDNWQTLEVGNSVTLNAGQTVQWRRINTATGNSFTSTGRFDAYGNIMSMEWGADFLNRAYFNQKIMPFAKMFYDSKIVSAKNIVFNSKITLVYGCYSEMFENCSLLTEAPKLPHLSIANSSYSQMFAGCTSLIKVPEIGAYSANTNACGFMFDGCTSLTGFTSRFNINTFGQAACQYMFQGCTSLSESISIRWSGSLGSNALYSMFRCCSSLKEVYLEGETLSRSSLGNMFADCSSLNKIYARFETVVNSTYSPEWMYGVNSTGSFYMPNSWSDSVRPGTTSTIPSGWEIYIE